jgi:hypothetical protein
MGRSAEDLISEKELLQIGSYYSCLYHLNYNTWNGQVIQ